MNAVPARRRRSPRHTFRLQPPQPWLPLRLCRSCSMILLRSLVLWALPRRWSSLVRARLLRSAGAPPRCCRAAPARGSAPLLLLRGDQRRPLAARRRCLRGGMRRASPAARRVSSVAQAGGRGGAAARRQAPSPPRRVAPAARRPPRPLAPRVSAAAPRCWAQQCEPHTTRRLFFPAAAERAWLCARRLRRRLRHRQGRRGHCVHGRHAPGAGDEVHCARRHGWRARHLRPHRRRHHRHQRCVGSLRRRCCGAADPGPAARNCTRGAA